MSRKELADYSGIIANGVENKFFSELQNATNISASFEGWTGIDTKHYLGVIVRALINGHFKWFTIDFACVKEVHATALELSISQEFHIYVFLVIAQASI